METWPFPPVEGLVETPIVRPGWFAANHARLRCPTRLIYRPAPGVTFPPLAIEPTPDEIQQALALLDEAIGEFPYIDDASKANTVALLLTPILRTAIAGPVPFALVDAPQAGTGKSLLTRVLAVIATGRSAAIMTAPAGDEEFRKKITATLLSGTTLILLDNVEGQLLAGSLAAVLTTDTWSDRVLGQSPMVTLPQTVTWVATGNNLSSRAIWRDAVTGFVSMPRRHGPGNGGLSPSRSARLGQCPSGGAGDGPADTESGMVYRWTA